MCQLKSKFSLSSALVQKTGMLVFEQGNFVKEKLDKLQNLLVCMFNKENLTRKSHLTRKILTIFYLHTSK